MPDPNRGQRLSRLVIIFSGTNTILSGAAALDHQSFLINWLLAGLQLG
jgi:hypothetical protein